MLRGRESLIRVIGNRRRFLPNVPYLLSTPIHTSFLNLSKNDENGESRVDVANEDKSNCSFVTCPVCGNTVRGEDHMLNTHLDVCLARGTKRKLTQRTLLELNFCSRPNKLQFSESDHLGSNVAQCGPDDDIIHKPIHENYSNQCGSPSKSDSSTQIYSDGSTNSPICDETSNHKLEVPSVFVNIEIPIYDVIEAVDDVCGLALQTIVVGRKFSDVDELDCGARITLQRDPDNVKDPNAVKVLSADTGCCEALGFVPKELAQYLSPLIEKYGLSFEGCVTTPPKHRFDVVPVQISCQRIISCIEKEYDDVNIFKSLWRNVFNAAQSSTTSPPSGTKYQHNFCLLVQEVLRSNSHLLNDDEKAFLESFTSLSDDSQRLFIRLYSRKGPWFRMSNISYSEILDSQQAVKELSEIGYLCLFDSPEALSDDDLKGVLNVLTVAELREVFCVLNKNSKHSTRKQDLVEALCMLNEDTSCPHLLSVVLERTGICIRISSMAESLIWRSQRLFFLNGEQDLSAFLLVDLGIVKYPNYNCIVSDQIFKTRTELLAYEEAIEVAQIMDQSFDDNKTELVLRCIEISDSRISTSLANGTQCSSSKPEAAFLSCFSAPWVYSKAVLLGVSFLECERRYNDAIALLRRLLGGFSCDKRRGYWTLRLSVDLEHIGHIDESLVVAENGLLDPWVRAGSRIALQRRVLRLSKPPRRWRTPDFSSSIKRKITEVPIRGRPLNCETGVKNRFYGEDGDQCGVEELALQYYAGEGGGWQGVHTESGIWLTIFGLIMWDIIFADVPNVFRTRFQTAPLDLETDSFYIVRKNLIESHLQKLHEGMAEEILITSWESHIGAACRGVNWDRHSLSELRAAVVCIGGPCLASICRHLAQDYRSWSSGMPDLLLWRFHGDYRGEAKLVEVKGPRDRLSEQQRAWLLILMDCGFSAEVCKVSPENPLT